MTSTVTDDLAAGMLADPSPDDLAQWWLAVESGWLVLDDEPPGVEAVRAEPWQLTATALVAELERTQAELSALHGRWLALLAEAEQREATLQVAGLPTASWLACRNTHGARSARSEVRLAGRLAVQPVVAEALGDATLSVEQAKVIVGGLDRLPEELDAGQRESVAAHLVELGREFGPHGLARLVNRAVEVVAPDVAEDADRRAVERAEAAQRRLRSFTWRHDPDDGGLLISGKLPAVAGEKLVGLLRALAGKARKSAALAGQELNRGQAHADALALLADHYLGCHKPPRLGADRPRIVVSIDYDTLLGRLGTATLLNTDQQVSAQQARLLACDAGVLPIVLGGGSVPLDVGREQRLFGSHLRAVLIDRDRGCAFPGCDRSPAECDAHHIRPWHDGGSTSLDNGVLVCEHHHHLVEPNPNRPSASQWAIRMDSRGHPEFGAPEGRGAAPGQRRWRQHHRYRC